MDAAFLDGALNAARDAAAAAADVIRHYYERGVATETKADQTPVTVADREAETVIKNVLRRAFPDHAFYGEEHGREGESEYLWLIDPIDGTKAFVRRYSMFSTQIALMHRGTLVLGELIRRNGRIRGYGDFLHYHLLARGAIDLVLESDVNILDIAALAVIVREAGGTFTTLEGGALTLETTSVLAGTPALHAQALGMLRAAQG